MNNEHICPQCGGPMEVMSMNFDNDELTMLLHCEDCEGGIDRDWRVVYSLKSVERYFFG